ncbi:transcription factor TCP20-like [Cynara cardunculus var. scolymus]|uniref:transcription factor TCP20-like n=1 Tax=Cynara cardunculus var. scolymus TaxID=59895 RepID=UPI000D63136F|nr:transcription factor TCP20-like [Cynara cardunculus var. scolymus]
MNRSSSNNTSTGESGTHRWPPALPNAHQPPPPPPPHMGRNVRPRNMARRSLPTHEAQKRITNFGPYWLPSPYMTPDLVPYQLTPVRALAPEYSQTETTNLAVPKLFAARIVQLKEELRLEDEGEAVKWLLKQSEPAIISATGTGTMPIMRSSSAGHSNVRRGGPLVISAPLAGNDYDTDHGESSTGDNE